MEYQRRATKLLLRLNVLPNNIRIALLVWKQQRNQLESEFSSLEYLVNSKMVNQ
jgi:hypothetical protein